MTSAALFDLGFTLLKWAAAAGIFCGLCSFLLKRLPSQVDAHTPHALLNKLLDLFGNLGLALLRAALSAADLDQIAAAVAAGQPLSVVVKDKLPAWVASLEAAAGPALKAMVESLVGTGGLATWLEQVILGALDKLLQGHLVVTEVAKDPSTPKQVVVLASGHMLVMPAGQAVPAGAVLKQAGD